MKQIYISPHADDVALSCGGQILANPARRDDCLVVTVFTSDLPEADLQAQASFSDALNSCRTAEDRSAWDSVGVSVRYIDLPEALLRKRFPFALLASNGDEAVIDRLCEALRCLIALYPEADFHFPAGVGLHVDHLICRDAGLRLVEEGALDRILLYEEAPYGWLNFIRKACDRRLARRVEIGQSGIAPRSGGLGVVGYLRRKNVPFPRGKALFTALWFSLTIGNLRHSGSARSLRGTIGLVRLDRDELAQKRALLFHYRSQLPMLFGSRPDRTLDAYATEFATEATIQIAR